MTTLKRWNAITVGTPICSACATIAISAIPPGAVAIIIDDKGKPKAHERLIPTKAEAARTKNALIKAKGINNLCRAKKARS